MVAESERPPPMLLEDEEEAPGTRPIEGRRSLIPREPPVPREVAATEEDDGAAEERGSGERAARPDPEEARAPARAPGADPSEPPSTRSLARAPERPAHDAAALEQSALEQGALEQSARAAPTPPDRRGLWFAAASVVVVGLGVYAIWSTPAPEGGDGRDGGGLTTASPPDDDAGSAAADAGPSAPRDAGTRTGPSTAPSDAAPTDAAPQDAAPPARPPDAGPASAPVPTPTSRGTLTVNALPWAEVLLDGRSLGNTPQRAVSVRAGAHTVELRNEYLAAPLRRRFEVPAGGEVTIFANLNVENPTIQIRGP